MSHFFTAQYLRPDGVTETRDFFVPSEAQVRKEIVLAGATVLSIERKRHGMLQKEWYSNDYKINFLKSIAMQARSGKSAGQALATVIGNEPNPRKRVELDAALQMIQLQGRDFSDAIAQLGIFDRSSITILRAGERTGMKRAVEAAVRYLSERKANVKELLGGLGWVSFEFVMALMSTIEVQFHILPMLAEQASRGKTPEEQLRVAHDIALAQWINGAFLALAVGAILGCCLAVFLYTTQMQVRARIDDRLLKIPVLNRFLVDGVMGQSFHIASIMLASHVTFFEVAETLAGVSAVPIVRRYWQGVARSLRSTSSTSESLAAGGMLHREEQQLLRHHEDVRQLAESLSLLAENRAESFKEGRKLFIRLGFGVMVFYSLVSIGVVGYLYMIYSSSLMSGLLESVGGGI
ncbi:hypothetical protein E4K72_03535 [Oxalobacteraceae bacterium OM1]|nr:hypothetical protein E4K72_03535 [Oxalobacteraceae bacterium OM1]